LFALLCATIGAVRVFWWGPGSIGLLLARHAPERIRAADRVFLYDTVITAERDQLVFRQSPWKPLRRALLTALALAIPLFLYAKRWTWLALAAAIAVFAWTRDSSALIVPRNGAHVVMRPYDVPHGVAKITPLYDDDVRYELVLPDGTALLRFPYNSQRDAEIWQKLIEEKLRP
jgi:hypothetical protein